MNKISPYKVHPVQLHVLNNICNTLHKVIYTVYLHQVKTPSAKYSWASRSVKYDISIQYNLGHHCFLYYFLSISINNIIF